MARPTLMKIAKARQLAEAGVDYSPKHGARCPWCDNRAKITTTRPWDDNVRIRYHRCQKYRCPVATMGISIKSIEVDLVDERS